MLFSYLKNRKQRVRLNITYSELIHILFGALQGAILGPLLFIIFLCDLSLFFHEIGGEKVINDKYEKLPGVKINHVQFQ